MTGDDAPLMVAITGPSGAGKSTVADAVRAAHGDAIVLQQDWYFISPSEWAPDADFCELRWIHVEEFVQAVQALARGEATEVPVVDFGTFERTGTTRMKPHGVVIVEGLTVLRVIELEDIFHAKFYLNTEMDIILARKRVRDPVERGKSMERIEGEMGWITDGHANDEALRQRSDVTVLDSGADIHSLTHSIVHHIRCLRRRRSSAPDASGRRPRDHR